MRIVSLNANGIRAAGRKGFFDWLAKQKADVVCIQETKAQVAQLDDIMYYPKGFYSFYHDAEKKGYSGVAIYCGRQPDQVRYGMGIAAADREGRWLEAQFGNLVVVSLYLPSGSSGDERQNFKFTLLEQMLPRLSELRSSGREYVICGDWNIAHKEIDLKNWKSNQKTSGFLPEERAWLDDLFNSVGFVDAFRVVNQEADQYTWWSNRGQAWAKNVGWRIDYQITTPGIGTLAKSTAIYKDERFSDHAPLTIDYGYEF